MNSMSCVAYHINLILLCATAAQARTVSSQPAELLTAAMDPWMCPHMCPLGVSFTTGGLELEGRVDQRVDADVRRALISHGNGWRGLNNPWMAGGEEGEEYQYINLVTNPERYTGYKVSVGRQ
jgi:hypothetical protein